MNKLIVIAGPTASGKTAVSIELAKNINGEIISADSMQCYKQMKIGTAKPSFEELNEVKHYMINEYDSTESISVYDYANKSKYYINTILEKNKIPIISGGSGLYIDSTVYKNFTYNVTATDENYRNELKKISEEKGVDYLYALLVDIDPEYAATTHKNNIKRVIRAIEFYKTNGFKMSEVVNEKIALYPNMKYFALNVDRSILYQKINNRVDKMIDMGLFDEVDFLYKNNLLSQTAKMAIGYKEIIQFFNNEYDKKTAVDLIKRNSRRYAKRQYTWFRANNNIIWIDATDREPNKICEEIINQL